MELKEMRTALWGFRKQDVCEYIASLSEELNAQLQAEKEKNRQLQADEQENQQTVDQTSADIERLNDEITRLNEELAALRQDNAEKEAAAAHWEKTAAALREENQTLRSEKARIADVLLDAKVFAKELRANAIAENEEFRQKNCQANQEIQEQLALYQNRVEQARKHLAALLQGIDGTLASAAEGLKELQNAPVAQKDDENVHD